MDSTFSRAALGFILLTAAVTGMALVALWALSAFAGGVWWASLLVVVVALGAEIMIYSSTLHDPVYDWIKEPKLKKLADEQHKRELERDVAKAKSQ